MMNTGDNIIGEKRNAEACQENEGKRLKQSNKVIPITLEKRSSRLDDFTLLEYLPKERICEPCPAERKEYAGRRSRSRAALSVLFRTSVDRFLRLIGSAG